MTRPATTAPRFFADRADPRVVLAYLGVALALSFLLSHPLYIAALTATAWVVLTALVPPRTYRPYAMYGSVAAVGVMLVNPLVSRAGQSIVWFGPTLPLIGQFNISAEAIVFGVAMGLRLLCVVALFALYSALVDPDAMYRIVAPFSASSALLTALSIRLFPTTVRDSGRISNALRSRGLALDAGTWRQRIVARIPVMDALLMTSLDRAMGLAEAMDSRGYGRAGRSRASANSLAPHDIGVLVLVGVCAVFGVWLALGPARFAYYPVVGDPARPLDVVLATVLAVLVAFPLFADWGWERWRSSKSRT
jgi:energy-coupling factor transport system permease protein